MAQPAPGGPPAVGVVRAERQQITETEEFIGRIQAVGAWLSSPASPRFSTSSDFVEGSEVKKGDLLYRLEQPPFEAQVDSRPGDRRPAAARSTAMPADPGARQTPVENARRTAIERRQRARRGARTWLRKSPAAQAQLRTAQINLGYTEIRAPIDGKISSTAVTEGNVVSPTSGTLATIVSQDPMYVLFPVAQRTGLDLRRPLCPKGGFSAVVIQLRLPDGRIYGRRQARLCVADCRREHRHADLARRRFRTRCSGHATGEPSRAN